MIATDTAPSVPPRTSPGWSPNCARPVALPTTPRPPASIPRQADLVGMSFCWSENTAVYVPIAHEPGPNCEGALHALLPLLADPALKKTGQNLKYDLEVLRARGHDLAGIDGDTMLADYLLDVDRKHNLDDLSQRHLGHTMLSFKEVAGQVDPHFERVPVDQATAYAAEDAHVAWLLDAALTPQLGTGNQPDSMRVYRDIELPLVPVLASMELEGIGIDTGALAELGEELGRRIDHLVRDIQTEAGPDFNVNSTQQLAQILFEERGHQPLKKTAKRTGYSTDSASLEALLNSGDPLPRLILDYRELAKLKSTYVDALPRAVADDGRIHTSFHQAVAATGRLSSNDPNLQNIPVRTDEGRRIRRCFVARPGHQFVSADYSQVELRVLAHFCGEGPLVDAFRNGEDIHRRTAAAIFSIAPEAVKPEQRRAAKAINFGIVYGMSAFRLARELGIGRAEAKNWIDGYFDRYPQVRHYMERAVQDGAARGYAETLLGRRRPLRGLDSRNFNERGAAERDRHQHAGPGHGRRFDQARDDQGGCPPSSPTPKGPPAAAGPRRIAGRVPDGPGFGGADGVAGGDGGGVPPGRAVGGRRRGRGHLGQGALNQPRPRYGHIGGGRSVTLQRPRSWHPDGGVMALPSLQILSSWPLPGALLAWLWPLMAWSADEEPSGDDGPADPKLPRRVTAPGQDPDHELVRAVLDGDATAYRGLVERYQGRIYSVCYGMVRNTEDARDLAQDAFVKAYQNLSRFRLQSSFYTWLCRIAMNVSIDHLRRQKVRRAELYEDGVVTKEQGGVISLAHAREDPSRNLERKRLQQRIAEAVDDLPEDQKQVIILREIEGLAYKEIAEVMQIPEGTVMSRLYYARKKLQATLKDQWE